MTGEECVAVSLSFSKDLSHEAKAKESTLEAEAKTKDFKIVLKETQGRGLVLEDSNTGDRSVVVHLTRLLPTRKLM